jgi:hypothetical protein
VSERPDKARASARPDGPSRRTLIAGATVAPLLLEGSAAVADQAVIACEKWLALRAEHERLARRWSRLEAKLAREHNYLRLSRRQQRALPEARELDDIDDHLEELHERQQTLLAVLPKLAATSTLGLAGKLAVAAVEVCPEENEEAHHLIASILRDLRAMTPPSA